MLRYGSNELGSFRFLALCLQGVYLKTNIALFEVDLELLVQLATWNMTHDFGCKGSSHRCIERMQFHEDPLQISRYD